MRAVIQRVKNAEVLVDGERTGAIEAGLLVYLGVGKDDGHKDMAYLAEKIPHLRILPDDEGRMNKSLLDKGDGILVVSQFTLYADTRKGRRPGYDSAAPPEMARDYYMRFLDALRERGLQPETGKFQAHMEVRYCNDGPVTILLDSKKAF